MRQLLASKLLDLGNLIILTLGFSQLLVQDISPLMRLGFALAGLFLYGLLLVIAYVLYQNKGGKQ